jgi:hypothetical protein
MSERLNLSTKSVRNAFIDLDVKGKRFKEEREWRKGLTLTLNRVGFLA